MSARLRDRRDAGRRLADALVDVRLHDPVVLALPRGGVPVGFEVAVRTGAPLDVLVARKVGAPNHPEFGIGAIAEGGAVVADEASLRMLGLADAEFRALADAERPELERRVASYRGGRPLPDVTGRDVVLVDDGLATGVTAQAAVLAVRALAPGRVLIGVPVCAADTAERFEAAGVEVVCTLRRRDFLAVGQWYDDFRQTTDAEVLELLAAAAAPRAGLDRS